MRILHIATHAGMYRGGAVQMCRMALGLSKRNHHVEVIVQRDDSASEEQRRQDLATWDPLLDGGIRLRALSLASDTGPAELREIFLREKFDFAHLHRDDALVAAVAACGESSSPLLVAQRGTVTLPPAEAAGAFRSEKVRAIVAVAQAVKDALGADQSLPQEKIHVIYGSVDLERFQPTPPDSEIQERLKIPPGSPVIGSLSAFRKAKGFSVMLPAIRAALRSHKRAHALFIGKKVRKHVRRLARELKLDDRCHFFDHRQNVEQWLSIMDLTVVAAESREGLSGVVRESLAMEIPVISTDCAGNREIVRDRETGLLVPVGDVDALRRALEWALDHPGEMKAMARAGRRWVVEHCSVEKHAEALESLYRSTLKGGA